MSSGNLAEAERLYLGILAAEPANSGALHALGVIRAQQGRNEEALGYIASALRENPGSALALLDYGNVLRALGRFEEALASYDRAAQIKPDHAALYNRGVILCDLKRHEEALASFDRALALKPDNVAALNNRGNILRELGRFEEALASYDKALAIKQNHVEALNNRGTLLCDLKRPEEALASFDLALGLRPRDAEVWNGRGNAMRLLGRFQEALDSYDRALAISPNHAGALFNRGSTFLTLKRFDEACASFERALGANPNHPSAFSGLADAALRLCDWARTGTLAGKMEREIAGETSIIAPFIALAYGASPPLQRRCAERAVREQMPSPLQPLWNNTPYRHDKIRVAYLSADFHPHATAFLTAELFERHDRTQFEIVGISFGRNDDSAIRARLVKGFDRFHDIRTQSDREVGELLRKLEIDIAVDLKGHTRNSRPSILAHRPAPVQVNYLGYPGTMGANYVDYVLADRYVLPFEDQPFYDEKIVHLPDCYQPNDSKRRMSAAVPSRRDAGLPEDAFVFCCFNNNYKMTAPAYDVWMRLLRSVEPRVLWLFARHELAKANLRREAAARGIDASRLVFLDELPHDEYLARHGLADLFLDTLPYNAHATGSNALWAGLPLLTCAGNTLAGRVGTSLLHAAGLPELVTHSLEDSEALARKLATDRELLQSIRDKLAQNRGTCPLFDTDRFRRHLEAAYSRMWELHLAGESPRSFAVVPQP